MSTNEQVEGLRRTIDYRLNNYLCEMKPGYDDSITGFNEAWEIVAKAFDAALQAGTEVAVKGLEWNPFRAETPFGYYYIDDQTDRPASELDGRLPFLLSGSRIDLSRHATLIAARAAAQADYEKRIRSALAPVQQAGVESELVERLRTAAKEIRDAWYGEEQDDALLMDEAAASLSQLQQRIADLEGRLATAYRVKAECNDDANAERRLRIAAEAALEAKDAKLVEAVERAIAAEGALDSIRDLEPGTQQWVDGQVTVEQYRQIGIDAVQIAKAARSFTSSIQEKGNGSKVAP